MSNTTTSTRYDVSQHGREGGIASGLSRRLRPQRELEAKILNGRNGQAQAFLLRVRMQREARLETERLRVDRELVELENWSARAREELEETLAELERARSEREAQLEAAKDGDHDALVALLAAAGEQRVEVALGQLGWLEDAEASS
jgi:hypothetical protein